MHSGSFFIISPSVHACFQQLHHSWMLTLLIWPCCCSVHLYFHFMWDSSRALCVVTYSVLYRLQTSQHYPKCFLFIIFNYPYRIPPLSFISVAAQIQLNAFYSICSVLSPRSFLKLGSEPAEAWFIQFSNLWNPKLTLFQQGYVSLDWNNFILDRAAEQNEMLRFKKLEEGS